MGNYWAKSSPGADAVRGFDMLDRRSEYGYCRVG
jgi:hypothetical protein